VGARELILGIIVRKYADLTSPSPAYGGLVYTCFSPKAWKHFLCDKEGKNLDELRGVTGILKQAWDKSQALVPWGIKVALARARALMHLRHMGPNGAMELWPAELDVLLADAKKENSILLESAGDTGHEAHSHIEAIILSIIAKNDNRLHELLARYPADDRATNAVVAALDFMIRHNCRWIASEQRALSLQYKYCGTLDGLCLMDSCDGLCCRGQSFKDHLSLIDWKTSNGKEPYCTYIAQSAAYVNAHEEEFKSEIIDRWIIILDKESADFSSWPRFGRSRQAVDFLAFRACLDTVERMRAIEKSIDAMAAERKAERDVLKADAREAEMRVRCPKAATYKGARMTSCLPDGSQCEACRTIRLDKLARG
jgi:hypothetical protein